MTFERRGDVTMDAVDRFLESVLWEKEGHNEEGKATEIFRMKVGKYVYFIIFCLMDWCATDCGNMVVGLSEWDEVNDINPQCASHNVGIRPRRVPQYCVIVWLLGYNVNVMDYNSDTFVHHCFIFSNIDQNINNMGSGFPLTSAQIPPTSGCSD